MEIHIKISLDGASRHLRRAATFILLPLAIVAGTAVIAHATLTPDPAVWAVPGKPISASSLAADLTQLDQRLTTLETSSGAAATQSFTVPCSNTSATGYSYAVQAFNDASGNPLPAGDITKRVRAFTVVTKTGTGELAQEGFTEMTNPTYFEVKDGFAAVLCGQVGASANGVFILAPQ